MPSMHYKIPITVDIAFLTETSNFSETCCQVLGTL